MRYADTDDPRPDCPYYYCDDAAKDPALGLLALEKSAGNRNGTAEDGQQAFDEEEDEQGFVPVRDKMIVEE